MRVYFKHIYDSDFCAFPLSSASHYSARSSLFRHHYHPDSEETLCDRRSGAEVAKADRATPE